ncbi:TadE/TadG family type IV pilus assembly protein [Methylobacterium planeticum]|uniref:TadE/TadG family type IV pilus assembly protein n=1 Tax=Methylobacterium planeticum TaxID=2615211 RepID=UPI001FEE983E|nr:TadE/TadG family type IV pilus assembly protein [Methylobacterium planeticum]
MTSRLRRFAAAREGVSAVEFGLIAPSLILMFMAAIDIPRAYTTGRRLALSTGAMADLISRGDFGTLADVYAAARTIAAPYDVGSASIVLTAAGVYETPGGFIARACSSAAQNDQARIPGTAMPGVPAGMGTNGARYVVAEVKMRYRAIFTIFPALNGWQFTYTKVWPVREGVRVNGQEEVVLPGGEPCPALPPGA